MTTHEFDRGFMIIIDSDFCINQGAIYGMCDNEANVDHMCRRESCPFAVREYVLFKEPKTIRYA